MLQSEIPILYISYFLNEELKRWKFVFYSNLIRLYRSHAFRNFRITLKVHVVERVFPYTYKFLLLIRIKLLYFYIYVYKIMENVLPENCILKVI